MDAKILFPILFNELCSFIIYVNYICHIVRRIYIDKYKYFRRIVYEYSSKILLFFLKKLLKVRVNCVSRVLKIADCYTYFSLNLFFKSILRFSTYHSLKKSFSRLFLTVTMMPSWISNFFIFQTSKSRSAFKNSVIFIPMLFLE